MEKTNQTQPSSLLLILYTDYALAQTFPWAARRDVTTTILTSYVVGRRAPCKSKCRNPPCHPLPDIIARRESDVNISTNMTTQPTNARRCERYSREMQRQYIKKQNISEFTYSTGSLLLLLYTCIAQRTFQENGVAGLYGVVTVQWLPIMCHSHQLQLRLHKKKDKTNWEQRSNAFHRGQ